MIITDTLNNNTVVMLDAGHAASWATGELIREPGGILGRYFVFMTVDAQTANQAERVLREANLLCSTKLQSWGEKSTK